jgi:hypothetical protein
LVIEHSQVPLQFFEWFLLFVLCEQQLLDLKSFEKTLNDAENPCKLFNFSILCEQEECKHLQFVVSEA